ncbi:MAG: hypothetical protein E7564_10835 [Ruminococcaceae bacterium]|nr:hypothetical protein [Oscillospiraceae bacterium]
MKLIPTQALHFIGNGHVAMAGNGADIVQLFAPCYSMPNVMTLRLKETEITAKSNRIANSAGYITELTQNGSTVGEIIDYTHHTLPVFIRRLNLSRPLEFSVEYPFAKFCTDSVTEGGRSYLFEIPEGSVIFTKSKTDKETYCRLILSQNCVAEEGNIIFPAGMSHLLFVGGDHGDTGTQSFADCMALSDFIQSADLDEIFREFLAHWNKILSCIKIAPSILASVNDGDELIESVAVALITQTSAQGGVVAGSFYHLAYGRDMYGVFRGYMALGLYGYARSMVEYMCETYRKKGFMPNASGMGMSCSHCHENDDVEQTGYYLLELLDYAEKTEDITFLCERMDYAHYLLTAQEKHLKNGMLPFNGDETYIAGGIFPRSGIDHGSLEATALYIGSASRLLEVSEKYNLMNYEEITAHKAKVADARERFTENFTDRNTVYINNPYRAEIGDTPAYRQGVCHHCNKMTNLIRDKEGGYLCAACYGKTNAPVTRERYSTDCALWMTVYAGCTLLPEATLFSALERSINTIRESNYGASNPKNAVGYEYGVILYTLAKLLPASKLPSYRDLLNALLSNRVEGAVWTEYYRNGKPSLDSCPYRPWESAINLCGILAYLDALNQ